MDSNWEEFYAKQTPPSDLEKSRKLLLEFTGKNSKVVLVTVSNNKKILLKKKED